MGVEPTQDRSRPLPGLKSGRPTGSDSLPLLLVLRDRYCKIVHHVRVMKFQADSADYRAYKVPTLYFARCVERHWCNFHGTRADLKPGDLIGPGYVSNYGRRKTANHIYFSATLEAATWGAELAAGEGRGRIYIVEPTGSFTDDPNLTDKKFPGNPTGSYRSAAPLLIIGELENYPRLSEQERADWRARLAANTGAIIN